eukprot:289414_1
MEFNPSFTNNSNNILRHFVQQHIICQHKLETLASFCSTTYNMSTQIPQVNKYYYHNHAAIPKNQQSDVIEKCGTNNRNAAFRFKSQEIYNFFNKRFVIQKSKNVSINTPIKPLSKLSINTPSKKK